MDLIFDYLEESYRYLPEVEDEVERDFTISKRNGQLIMRLRLFRSQQELLQAIKYISAYGYREWTPYTDQQALEELCNKMSSYLHSGQSDAEE